MRSVSSLEGYIAEVESICREWHSFPSTTLPWFRGQGDSGWRLVPGLYRGGIIPILEREMVREFKLSAVRYLDQVPARDIEWLFVMQHYGVPTRLLDWTEASLTALYFAVEDSSLETTACVWVLEPWSLNQISLGAASIPTSDHPSLNDYIVADTAIQVVRRVRPNLPAAVRPVRATSRILAQRGVFTIHGNRISGLEEFRAAVDGDVRLDLITIEAENRRKIKRQLSTAGITTATLFPDIEGVCGEITYRYSSAWDYTIKEEVTKDRGEDGVWQKDVWQKSEDVWQKTDVALSEEFRDQELSDKGVA